MRPMMGKLAPLEFAILLTMVVAAAQAATPSGDATQGAQLYSACAACHSLVPDRNMTGPSLAGIWGRKAGSLESFERYSPALKSSDVVWDEKSLDQWLTSPPSFIPNNRMTFAGIADPRQRADLVAFLREVGAGRGPTAALAQVPTRAPFQNLKKIGPEHQVQAIHYCQDTYHVITADGQSTDFWESNLRLKTDSSDTGPENGKPVILPGGMMGDRASVFFAAPGEISTFIKHQC